MLLIFAITDEFNAPPGANLAPLMIGLVVVAIGMSFGGMHGYAINPARDFGPRLFTVFAGFRNNGLTDGLARLVDSRSSRHCSGGLPGGRRLRLRHPALPAPFVDRACSRNEYASRR